MRRVECVASLHFRGEPGECHKLGLLSAPLGSFRGYLSFQTGGHEPGCDTEIMAKARATTQRCHELLGVAANHRGLALERLDFRKCLCGLVFGARDVARR